MFFFSKIVLFTRQCRKIRNGLTVHCWQDKTARALCVLVDQGYIQSHRIRNSYCFYTITMVMRMHFHYTFTRTLPIFDVGECVLCSVCVGTFQLTGNLFQIMVFCLLSAVYFKSSSMMNSIWLARERLDKNRELPRFLKRKKPKYCRIIRDWHHSKIL